MSHLAFAQPAWLAGGALACLGALVLMARADRLRKRAAALLAGGRAVVSVGRGRRLAKRALVLLGTACAFVALARPRWGYRWEIERQSGVDLMFAVDTSKSMLARDLAPDRLTRAKLAVADLLREFPGERAGLIAFAGSAFVEAPMTLDQAVFSESLAALDSDVIPRGGTNIGSAIRTAVAAMASEPEHRKVLVILTDGEDLEGDATAAAAQAARAGVVIYTVGVGTPAGALVPVDRDGRPGVMLDADGQPVRSRLDEKTLRGLAAITGGAYATLGAEGRGLESLYRQHLAALPRRAAEERTHKVWTERFQIPLGIGIACLLLDLALGERRRGRVESSAAVGAAAALVLLLGAPRLASAATASASGPPAEQAATTTYNEGTAAYRKHDFDAAKAQFQSATHTTDLGLQEDAYYDLGNARYRVGQAALAKRDREAARASWKEALAAYDGALALAPKDADARFNRDLVARRLKELDREDQQQKKPDRSQSPQSQNQQKNDNGGQGQQGQSSSLGQGQAGSSSGKGQSGAAGGERAQSAQPQGGQQGAPNQSAANAQGGSAGSKPSAAANALAPSRAPQSSQPPQSAQPSQASQASSEQKGAGETIGAAASGAKPGEQPSRGAPPPSPTPKGPGVVGGAAAPTRSEARADSERRDPGALTPREARQLLDSVSGELRPLPAAGDTRRPPGVEAKPEKDW